MRVQLAFHELNDLILIYGDYKLKAEKHESCFQDNTALI